MERLFIYLFNYLFIYRHLVKDRGLPYLFNYPRKRKRRRKKTCNPRKSKQTYLVLHNVFSCKALNRHPFFGTKKEGKKKYQQSKQSAKQRQVLELTTA